MIVFFFQLAFRFGRSSHDCIFQLAFKIWVKSSHDYIFFSASFQIWEKSSHDCIFFS